MSKDLVEQAPSDPMVVGVAVAQDDTSKIEELKESMAAQEKHFVMELAKQREEISRLREQVKRPRTVFDPEIGFITSDDPNFARRTGEEAMEALCGELTSRSNLPKILGIAVFASGLGLAIYFSFARVQ